MPEQALSIDALGWSSAWEEQFAPWHAQSMKPGRIGVEDKHYYTILTQEGDLIGQISGKLLHETPSSAALPKVGDWVAFTRQGQEAKVTIHQVLPRRTKLSRKFLGRDLEEQVLATNVDTAFVV